MHKLDGRLDQNFFDQKSKEWKKAQYDIFRKIERHQRAEGSYMEEGVKLLELAQRAVTLYEKQNMREKRRIINSVCSNSPWKDGRLLPNYRKPFDILSETNRAYKRKKATFVKKSDRFDICLPEGYECENLKYAFILDGYDDRVIPRPKVPQFSGQIPSCRRHQAI